MGELSTLIPYPLYPIPGHSWWCSWDGPLPAHTASRAKDHREHAQRGYFPAQGCSASPSGCRQLREFGVTPREGPGSRWGTLQGCSVSSSLTQHPLYQQQGWDLNQNWAWAEQSSEPELGVGRAEIWTRIKSEQSRDLKQNWVWAEQRPGPDSGTAVWQGLHPPHLNPPEQHRQRLRDLLSWLNNWRYIWGVVNEASPHEVELVHEWKI